MSWTKREFVNAAFEEIGYASYVYGLQPEQLQAALRRLDAMMATWNANGIRIGYPLPGSPGASDLDALTTVPDAANQAIYTNLALVLAPTVGKTVSIESTRAARAAYDALLRLMTQPPKMSFPSTLPAGAGNKPWRERQDPFLPGPRENIDAGDDSVIDF